MPRSTAFALGTAMLIAAGTTGPANAADTGPAPEKKEVHLAAAGLGFPYLPFMIADRLGYFKDAGLDVHIGVFSGGSKALEALLGGSADVVAGAYSHTITMQTKGQHLVSFAVQANCPGWVFGITKAASANVKSIADLKGKRIGVSAPGSSFHQGVSYLLSKAGVKPNEVSIIGIGASATTIAAVEAGQVDALIINDPIATMLTDKGDMTPLVEMRSDADNRKVFGGDYTEASLYATQSFVDQNPNTVQAMANAMVRAERWIAKATPEQVYEQVPPNYFVKDKGLFVKAFSNMRHCLSQDGTMSLEAAKTVYSVLAAFNPTVEKDKIDLKATFDNRFVDRADKRAAGQ